MSQSLSGIAVERTDGNATFHHAPPGPRPVRRTAQCDVMTVVHLAPLTRPRAERTRERIEILLPSVRSVFHARHPGNHGRSVRTFVRGPLVCVVPPRTPHSLDCPRPADVVVLALDPEYFRNHVRDVLGAEPPAMAPRYCAHDPFMRALGDTLREQFERGAVPSEAYLRSLAGMVSMYLAMKYAGTGAEARSLPGLAKDKLDRVREYVAAHLGESLAVKTLASTVHMSPYHFARMFKKATGQPPHVYITAQRVERAKLLLRESSLPLVDVAAEVGFQTQGHFTVVFHKHTGVTPRAYRVGQSAGLHMATAGAGSEPN